MQQNEYVTFVRVMFTLALIRKTAEKNRLSLAARPIQKRVRAHILCLEKELAGLTTELTTTMQQSLVWREKVEVLRSVPGVGPVLVTTLLPISPSWEP